ncbi:glucosylglycerol hydrolase [Immundisolibacter sp.]|uniref:glucosylglycerol hydrolase n=1 Tax=Immundisolibacter sp. TaxID=1934948 RepID=UPI00356463F5
MVLEAETAALCEWARQQRAQKSPFEAARAIARRLGAHVADGGTTAFGFWLPEVRERGIHPKCVFLELFEPLGEVDFHLPMQELPFRRHLVPLVCDDDYYWVVLSGLTAGNRERVGALYWVRCQDNEGNWWTRPDYLPWSSPFGAFAPAELYDRARLNRERADLGYFQGLPRDADGMAWIEPSVNLLEIHPPTACAETSLAGLTRIFAGIARKLTEGKPLTPFEQCYAGYDGVQLMPIEPTVTFENGPSFFEIHDDQPGADGALVTLRRPTACNWGYDVVVSGMSAVNPRLLESSRPDELVDFIATLHTFPGRPIKVVFDLVYGHADNQALTLLNRHFVAGPNMYGQNLNYRHPVVRAILLEMAARKMGFGADGLRVDGAQDFNYWDEEGSCLVHDDEFLLTMGHQPIAIAGMQYRPWTIFEDGRPWPREDYQLSSSYRALIEQDPRAFQWGPLTFAHNTPFASAFWISKWWRLEESAFLGEKWISGVANHDTRRRGAQTDPHSVSINRRLGDTLPDILLNAYDHIGFNLLFHAFLPGVPLDFINTNVRAPWGFLRNTDDRYAVKVMEEEWRSMLWQIDEQRYQRPDFFIRLKELGFLTFADLEYFMQNLARSMLATQNDVARVAQFFDSLAPSVAGPKPLDVAAMSVIARAWMDDMHAYCNVALHQEDLDAAQTAAMLAVRHFRQDNPWLAANLGDKDCFYFRRPVDGTVLVAGLRRHPENTRQVLLLLNLEGEPATLNVADMMPQAGSGWRQVLPDESPLPPKLTLSNGEGLVAVRNGPA